MRKLLSVIMIATLLTFGCTTTPTGDKVPNTTLIKYGATIASLIILQEVKKKKLDPNEILLHVQNMKALVNADNYDQYVLVLNAYLQKYLPGNYKIVGSMVLSLIQDQVEPILTADIDKSQKAEQVLAVIEAVLDGIERAILLHQSNNEG